MPGVYSDEFFEAMDRVADRIHPIITRTWEAFTLQSRPGNHRDHRILSRVCSSPRLTRHGSVVSIGETEPDEATQHRNELLTALKKEVKVIMEEAVTKRQIDLDSPYVTSLCVAVENCLMDGLRRRLLGLFGNRTSLALLHTIAKTNAVAEQVLAKTLETNSQYVLFIQRVVLEHLFARTLRTFPECSGVGMRLRFQRCMDG
ncbi:hypothetical protein ANCCAN_21149 [Ancylostoma caninum]|uniref:Uncharacterized protein n=1 Tax=Ancylostoma caninum TaxID=29170 RepID=A0A368FQB6_ANCCA|nr:hypothetical protein ANCCAN_21149 [Ancylostoma caninum]